MIKNALTLLILGTTALGLVAQEESEKFYIGVSAGFSQADLRVYQGGKTYGYAYELGYNFFEPDDFIGIRLYGRYARWTGDYSERYDVQQDLLSWGAGLEFSFKTPQEGLRPYLGFSITGWDGKRVTDSAWLGYTRARNILGMSEAAARDQIYLAGPHSESQGKLGFRFGVEYNVWNGLGVSLDYNVHQWMNLYPTSGKESERIINTRLKGYNRVNPSFIGLTVKYHFNMEF
jgi:hypothetical protein